MARDPAMAWMGAAFGANLALAGAVFAAFGAGPRGTDIALQATARLAFLLFLGAYAAAPLARLFGPPWPRLARRGRSLGLGFAAALAVHIGLVAWRCAIGHVPAPGVFLTFLPPLGFTILMALLSLKRWQRWREGPLGWVARRIGMHVIALAFVSDFFKPGAGGGAKFWIGYVPFLLLAAGAPLLHVAALLPRAASRRAALAGPGAG